MAKLYLIGLVEPAPGREADFEAWYLDNHVEDSSNDPIFDGATCYELVKDRHVGAPGPRFLTIYEVDEQDPDVAHDKHADYVNDPSAWPERLPDNGSMRIVGAGWYRLARSFRNRSKGGGAGE